MREFDVRIGWRSPGHYHPASEWLLSAWKYSDRTIAHARFTVIGFYILMNLYKDAKKEAENNG